ncbi:MAG: nucleotide exchange factor GrpE [Clostridiales bacterium]|nr:nucleotide exchange factor GrpE [Clostridiales bacterium]
MTSKKDNEKNIDNEVVEDEDCGCTEECKEDCDCQSEFEEAKEEKKAKKPKKERKVKEKTELEKLQDERNAYLELAQRTKAEFDNFKKRNASLRTESINDGIREAVTALLPVIDNLERAIEVDSEHEYVTSIKEGVEMIFSQMLGVLESLGLEEIEAEEKVFDPNLHHAVMQDVANNDYPEDTIMEVFQKGYSLRGKIIRHSMVKVAK